MYDLSGLRSTGEDCSALIEDWKFLVDSLGVPTFWRDLNADCNPDPYLHELIRQCDIVMPWMVQRFSPLLHNDMGRYRDLILNDISWCKVNV